MCMLYSSIAIANVIWHWIVLEFTICTSSSDCQFSFSFSSELDLCDSVPSCSCSLDQAKSSCSLDQSEVSFGFPTLSERCRIKVSEDLKWTARSSFADHVSLARPGLSNSKSADSLLFQKMGGDVGTTCELRGKF
jgi:hypothetical protein